VSVRSVVLNVHPDDGPFFVTCANPGCCNPIHLTSEPPEVRVGRVKLKLLKESLEDVEGTDERERAKVIKHSATMTYSELKYAETAATMRSGKLKELRKEISKIERCVVTWDRENAQKLRTRARKSETKET
jgi:hypothetical protein